MQKYEILIRIGYLRIFFLFLSEFVLCFFLQTMALFSFLSFDSNNILSIINFLYTCFLSFEEKTIFFIILKIRVL